MGSPRRSRDNCHGGLRVYLTPEASCLSPFGLLSQNIADGVGYTQRKFVSQFWRLEAKTVCLHSSVLVKAVFLIQSQCLLTVLTQQKGLGVALEPLL